VRLSIVIVNWNTRELLANCLESIYNSHPRFPFEVIVVDNASSDGSAEMVRELFPKVRLLENRENAGFAKATNQGINLLDSEYVLLLNPDTLVLSDALQVLVDFMDAHQEAGAAGSRILNPDGSLQTSCYVTPTLLREFARLFHLETVHPKSSYRMDRWDTDTPRRVEIIQGDCLLLRKVALDQVGLLDEEFFIYSEDVDLCYRLQKASWALYWVPQAQLIHYGGQSTRQVAAEMFLKLYQGKLMYFRKHHGKTVAFGYKILLLIAALPRFLLIPWAVLAPAPRRHHYQNLANNYRRLLGALPSM
jgi:GT2 family glycosyltransferase